MRFRGLICADEIKESDSFIISNMVNYSDLMNNSVLDLEPWK